MGRGSFSVPLESEKAVSLLAPWHAARLLNRQRDGIVQVTTGLAKRVLDVL